MEIRYVIFAAVIIGLLAFLLLPSGPEYADCGTDKDCFKAAAANCTKAVFTLDDVQLDVALFSWLRQD